MKNVLLDTEDNDRVNVCSTVYKGKVNMKVSRTARICKIVSKKLDGSKFNSWSQCAVILTLKQKCLYELLELVKANEGLSRQNWKAVPQF